MARRRPIGSPRLATLLTSVVSISLALPAAAANAREPTLEPTDPPVHAVDVMPPVAEGDVAVRFSLAPTAPEDLRLTVLTRWRTCGIWNGDWYGPEPDDEAKGVAARAHLVTTANEVRVRVDVGIGPDGEACGSERLVRLPIALEAPLGDRAIVDAADPTYVPVVNLVDAPDTGLRYSCDAGYPGGVGFTVPELLGPGLVVPAELDPPSTTLRIARLEGDAMYGLGDVKPNGRVPWRRWQWRSQEGEWGGPGRDYRCELIADSADNQATATWRLRGKRPNARSKAIKVWVDEQVCNGRPLYGRVAQPVRIDTEDGIIFVASSMRQTVDYEGRYIEDPWERWKGKPGVASHAAGRFAFVDCPGIGPAPYTFNLFRRLGDRTLYDGAHFPPRERPGRSDD